MPGSCCGLLGAIGRHEPAHLGFSLRPDTAASAQLANEVTVAECLIPKRRGTDALRFEKCFDVVEQVHAARIRCDNAHRQGVFFRDYPADPLGWISTPMAEVFDIGAVRVAVQRHMDRVGIARKPLAKKSGLGETAIRDLFNPERKFVRADTLVKLADYFETTVDELSGREPVYLAGKIGAGGAILFEEDAEPEVMPRPAFTPGKLMALRVVGDSMFPKWEGGDVVYVRRDHEGVLEEYLGDYCAVHTADGGTFLKILIRGSDAGRYTLRSLNAADMENVEVVWASPVEGTIPRRALEKWKARQ